MVEFADKADWASWVTRFLTISLRAMMDSFFSSMYIVREAASLALRWSTAKQ